MKNLTNMLDMAITQKNEERKKTLLVASDYAAMELKDDLLSYLLKFMAANKKFPYLQNKKTLKKNPVKFDAEKARNEFLEIISKNKPKGSLDRLWQTHLRNAKKEFDNNSPKIYQTKTIYNYVVNPHFDMKENNIFPSHSSYKIGSTPSWEELLTILKHYIEPFYKSYYLIQ